MSQLQERICTRCQPDEERPAKWKTVTMTRWRNPNVVASNWEYLCEECKSIKVAERVTTDYEHVCWSLDGDTVEVWRGQGTLHDHPPWLEREE